MSGDMSKPFVTADFVTPIETPTSTESAAFPALLEPHLHGLYRLAYRLTGTIDAAQELLQEALNALYRRRAELAGMPALRPRLRRVLYNQSLESARRHGAKPASSFEQRLAEIEAVPAAVPRQSAERGAVSYTRILAAALDKLSAEHRTILLLGDAEGLTPDELHDMTGVPTATLIARLERARVLLRVALEGYDAPLQVGSAAFLAAALSTYPVAGPAAGFFATALTHAAQAPADQRPGRAPRIVAAGFLGAFATSILTVILTGLYVRGPESKPEPSVTAVALAPRETRTVDLVFDSATAVDDVSITVELPRGVELAGHAGERQVGLRMSLRGGNNTLPLELLAVDGRGGQVIARLEHGGVERVFVVAVTIQ